MISGIIEPFATIAVKLIERENSKNSNLVACPVCGPQKKLLVSLHSFVCDYCDRNCYDEFVKMSPTRKNRFKAQLLSGRKLIDPYNCTKCGHPKGVRDSTAPIGNFCIHCDKSY